MNSDDNNAQTSAAQPVRLLKIYAVVKIKDGTLLSRCSVRNKIKIEKKTKKNKEGTILVK